jgi:hypothetical protein
MPEKKEGGRKKRDERDVVIDRHRTEKAELLKRIFEMRPQAAGDYRELEDLTAVVQRYMDISEPLIHRQIDTFQSRHGVERSLHDDMRQEALVEMYETFLFRELDPEVDFSRNLAARTEARFEEIRAIGTLHYSPAERRKEYRRYEELQQELIQTYSRDVDLLTTVVVDNVERHLWDFLLTSGQAQDVSVIALNWHKENQTEAVRRILGIFPDKDRGFVMSLIQKIRRIYKAMAQVETHEQPVKLVDVAQDDPALDAVEMSEEKILQQKLIAHITAKIPNFEQGVAELEAQLEGKTQREKGFLRKDLRGREQALNIHRGLLDLLTNPEQRISDVAKRYNVDSTRMLQILDALKKIVGK